MTEPLWRLRIPLEQESGQTLFPPQGLTKIESFDNETTEADIGRLRISFLRIQVERSSDRRIWSFVLTC